MVRVEEATKMGRVPSRPSTGEASRLSFGHSKNISLWNHHVPSRRISRYSLYLKVPFLLSPPDCTKIPMSIRRLTELAMVLSERPNDRAVPLSFMTGLRARYENR